MSGTWTKPRHIAVQIFKKMFYWIVFLCNEAFSPKTQPNLVFFCLNWFAFVNFESKESEFPMAFNMFVNMFWIAEGFGYVVVTFKLWPVNKNSLIFILE